MAEEDACAERPPVLLVPGAVGQDLLYWNVLRRRLKRDGWGCVAMTFPRFTLQDLRLSAEHLGRRVEAYRRETEAEKVLLVAHSMGGLIARWYLRFLGGDAHVAGVVYLSVPHRGTVAGLTGLPFRGARQVVPGSAFLNEINAAETALVPTTNVWSVTDLIVIPQTSARLELDGVVDRQVTLAGHWGMLVSREAYGHVRDGLARAAPAADAPRVS